MASHYSSPCQALQLTSSVLCRIEHRVDIKGNSFFWDLKCYCYVFSFFCYLSVCGVLKIAISMASNSDPNETPRFTAPDSA